MADEQSKPSPQAAQAKARIEAVKRGFEQRRNINQKLRQIMSQPLKIRQKFLILGLAIYH